MLLKPLESFRQLCEGGAVTQRAGLLLNNRQIMTPIVDRAPLSVVGSINNPLMLAKDLAGASEMLGIGWPPKSKTLAIAAMPSPAISFTIFASGLPLLREWKRTLIRLRLPCSFNGQKRRSGMLSLPLGAAAHVGKACFRPWKVGAATAVIVLKKVIAGRLMEGKGTGDSRPREAGHKV